MPTVTVAVSNNQTFQLNYNANDALGYAQGLENSINAQVAAGQLATFNYAGGKVAPAGASASAVVFTTDTLAAGAVLAPSSVAAILDAAAGPVSVWGGSAVQSVLAGSGGLSYYAAAAPTGLQTIVAGDGANWISTQSVGGGNYPGLFNALVLAGESGMPQGGVDVAAGLTRGIPETANI